MKSFGLTQLRPICLGVTSNSCLRHVNISTIILWMEGSARGTQVLLEIIKAGP